jgi:hypothetical protein
MPCTLTSLPISPREARQSTCNNRPDAKPHPVSACPRNLSSSPSCVEEAPALGGCDGKDRHGTPAGKKAGTFPAGCCPAMVARSIEIYNTMCHPTASERPCLPTDQPAHSLPPSSHLVAYVASKNGSGVPGLWAIFAAPAGSPC